MDSNTGASASVTHPLIGRLTEFCPATGNLEIYLERFEAFARVNNFDEQRKTDVVITVLGDEAYMTLRNLVFPETPEKKTYQQIKEVLLKHYKPKRSIVTERYSFHKRTQGSQEPIDEFIVQLKRLAMNCSFGAFLSEALRDQLVVGVRSEGIRCKLLAVEDGNALTWEKACVIATSMEAAEGHAREMVPAPTHLRQPDVDANWQRSDQLRRGTAGPGQPTPAKDRQPSCFRCGRQHQPQDCRHIKARCFNCSKLGHLASMCRTKRSHFTEEQEVSSVDLYVLEKTNCLSYVVQIEVNGKLIPMEIDTGSAVSIIPEKELLGYFSEMKYEPMNFCLRTYNGTTVPVKGRVTVTVKHEGVCFSLPIVVAATDKERTVPTLLGRDWLKHLRLNWSQVLRVNSVSSKQELLLDKFHDVFGPFGTIKGFRGSIALKAEARPVFCKARVVPYALKGKVEKELRDLETKGVLYPVQESEWATPLVVVPKSDGSAVRLCGDYHVTLNPCITVAHYPLPLPEDVFASLAGGTSFTVLDLSKAYLQLEMEAKSQELMTINTHLGLFRFTRLPFGVASAPAIFQSVMDRVLKELEGTVCYLDDVLIAGRTEGECLRRTEQVLKRLRQHGIRVNIAKCQFLQSRVRYLGHEIDAAGIHPTKEKVEAILKAPKPTSVTELKAFFGIGKFLRQILVGYSDNPRTTVQATTQRSKVGMGGRMRKQLSSMQTAYQ